MDANSKHQKPSGEDRISRLADDVLCHILSFLPTKYAVCTSVLSKRWKHVWTYVSSLDFDDSLLLRQRMLNRDDAQTCFTTFVNKVLSLHNLSCLRRFCLECTNRYDLTQANSWICAALTPNVVELDFRIVTMYESLDLPQRLYYTCQNLVHLKVRSYNLVLNVSSSVWLPRLKTLLLNVTFGDDDSLKKLLSGCPVLEDLYIDREIWDNAFTLYVCSTSLRRLTIDNTLDFEGGESVYNLVVEAPNLHHLILHDYTTENYKMNDLSSLFSANIDVMRSADSSPLVQLLKDVSNVKELRLSSYVIDDLRDTSYGNLPVFHSLIHLKVEIFQKDRTIVPYLLERSPNLKSLIVEKTNETIRRSGRRTQRRVYDCLSMHLETIEIDGFEGREDDMKMIGYFLKNAMVLKMITIYSIDLDSEKISKILEELLMFPKTSRTCQIALH